MDRDGLFLAYTTPSDPPHNNDIILKEIIPSINKNPKEVLTEANKIKFPMIDILYILW